SFMDGIDSLATSLPLTMALVFALSKRSHDELSKKFSEKEVEHSDGDIYLKYERITEEIHYYFQKLMRRASRADLAAQIIPRSFHVSLVSQFDAFIGNLISPLSQSKCEFCSHFSNCLVFSVLCLVTLFRQPASRRRTRPVGSRRDRRRHT